jgi:hypothetical protein
MVVGAVDRWTVTPYWSLTVTIAPDGELFTVTGQVESLTMLAQPVRAITATSANVNLNIISLLCKRAFWLLATFLLGTFWLFVFLGRLIFWLVSELPVALVVFGHMLLDLFARRPVFLGAHVAVILDVDVDDLVDEHVVRVAVSPPKVEAVVKITTRRKSRIVDVYSVRRRRLDNCRRRRDSHSGSRIDHTSGTKERNETEKCARD